MSRFSALFFLLVIAPLARAQGSDWPKFLGPLSTSVSSEKGIRSPWPKQGPPIVWQKEVGPGYAMPVIARGKLYHFDRAGRSLRLTCMNAETGASLWDFDYPSIY